MVNKNIYFFFMTIKSDVQKTLAGTPDRAKSMYEGSVISLSCCSHCSLNKL